MTGRLDRYYMLQRCVIFHVFSARSRLFQHAVFAYRLHSLEERKMKSVSDVSERGKDVDRDIIGVLLTALAGCLTPVWSQQGVLAKMLSTN